MTQTLILHIGHYKTGTTALQVFCERNAGALARLGLRYATSGRHLSKHSAFAFSLLRAGGATTLMHGYRRPDPPAAVWEPLLTEVRTAGAASVLISSEEFMRLAMFPDAVAALQRILRDAPDIRIKVLAWLRPVGPHLRSWHNQMVKMGKCRVGFGAAVCSQFEAIHHDYARALAPWAALAGPAGLILRPYDPSLRLGTRLYEEFAAALGLRLPIRATVPDRDPNPRLDDRLLDLVRLCTLLQIQGSERSALIARAERHLAIAARQAAADEAGFAALHARAAASINDLARLTSPGFPLASFRNHGPEAPDTRETQTSAVLEAALQDRAERIAALQAELDRAQRRIAQLEARIPRDLVSPSCETRP